jgi:hypothetical protein
MAAGEITSKTVEDRLRSGLTKLFRHGIEEMRNKVLIARPTRSGISGYKGQTDAAAKYVDFTHGDVRQILTRSRGAAPQIKWPNWLTAYSGGRLAEVVEARTSDVEITEDGTVIFHIRRRDRPTKQSTLKTGELSERPVPLHRAVLSEGFLAYVQQVKDD